MTKQELTSRAYQRMLARSIRMPNGCLEYQGAHTSVGGYPAVRVGDTIMRGNRLAWEAERGSLRKGQMALHDCDNTRCVDIAHLHAGTHRQNMAEMTARRRQASGERAHSAKISNTQADEIRLRYFTETTTMRTLAAEYGVNQSAICRIIARRTFAA